MKRFLALSIILFSFTAAYAKDIVLYHTGDTHGHYFAEDDGKGNLRGGFPALAAFIKKDSADNPHYLLLDSGDFLQGSLEADESKGATSVEVFNAVGYNAVTIGNHEFDFNGALSARAAGLNADIIAANFEGIPNAVPYKIYDLDGFKIVVVGIGLNGDKNKNFKELDTIESYRKAIEAASALKPDAVVLLTHLSCEDKRLPVGPKTLVESFAKKPQVVLSGHAHVKKIKTEKGTLFVESGANVQSLSKITMSFDDNTKQFTGASAVNVELYISKTGEDEEIKTLVESIRNPAYDNIVCETNNCLLFDSSKRRVLDNELSNFLTRAMKQAAAEGEAVDFALINTKSFRDDIPKGAVKERDIKRAAPYDDKLAIVKADGAFIEKLIRETIAPDFSLFQFSGLKIKAVFAGGEVKRLNIKINGKPLDPQKKYTFIANEAMAIACKYEGEHFKYIPAEDKKSVDISTKALLIEALNEPDFKVPGTGNIKVRNKKR